MGTIKVETKDETKKRNQKNRLNNKMWNGRRFFTRTMNSSKIEWEPRHTSGVTTTQSGKCTSQMTGTLARCNKHAIKTTTVKAKASQNGQPSQLFQAFGPVSSPPYQWMIVGSSKDIYGFLAMTKPTVASPIQVIFLLTFQFGFFVLITSVWQSTNTLSAMHQANVISIASSNKSAMYLQERKHDLDARRDFVRRWKERHKKDTNLPVSLGHLWVGGCVELNHQKMYIQLRQTAHILSTGICNVGREWNGKSKIWHQNCGKEVNHQRGLPGLISLWQFLHQYWYSLYPDTLLQKGPFWEPAAVQRLKC